MRLNTGDPQKGHSLSVMLITLTSPLTSQAVNANEINLLIFGLIKLLNTGIEEQKGKENKGCV